MATQKFQVPTVKDFWQHSGEKPPLKWDSWKLQLDTFFVLTDVGLAVDAKLTDTQKNMLLHNLLGAEGTRQFEAHPQSSNFACTYSVYSAVCGC